MSVGLTKQIASPDLFGKVSLLHTGCIHMDSSPQTGDSEGQEKSMAEKLLNFP